MNTKEHIKNPHDVYCETCPIRDNCKAYDKIEKVYHYHQPRASAHDCPLLKTLDPNDRVYVEFDL